MPRILHCKNHPLTTIGLLQMNGDALTVGTQVQAFPVANIPSKIAHYAGSKQNRAVESWTQTIGELPTDP